MTDRDLTPAAPTCPVCATRERVERERQHWICCKCWTLFTGSPSEWEQMRKVREDRAERYAYAAAQREAREQAKQETA